MLTCIATGNPAPSVLWQKKDENETFVPVPGKRGIWVSSPSTIYVSRDADEIYRCVAKNKLGENFKTTQVQSSEFLVVMLRAKTNCVTSHRSGFLLVLTYACKVDTSSYRIFSVIIIEPGTHWWEVSALTTGPCLFLGLKIST